MAEMYNKQQGLHEADKEAKKEAETQPIKEPKKAAIVEAEKKLAVEGKAEKKGEAKKEEAKGKEKAPAAKEREKPKEERKREIVLERVYNVNLQKAYGKPLGKRANTAIKLLRKFLGRHFKTDEDMVRLAPELGAHINGFGSHQPPKHVKVQANKDKEGLVMAKLAA